MDDIKAHKAKRKLSKDLTDKSWQLEGFHAQSETVLTAYIYDPCDSKALALAGFTLSNIEHFKTLNEPMEVVSTMLEQHFDRYLLAKVSATGAYVENRLEALGTLMGAYMVNTKTYTALCENEDEGYRHFITLLYRNKYTKDCAVRPFSLVNQQQFLDGEQVKALAQQVIVRDETVNPQFFSPSPVVSIKS